jgi:penicillin V acylase-like amidase (Ntn superfamily)
MEMPDGYKRLCWHRDGMKDQGLDCTALTFTEAADLMKEMAEALEKITHGDIEPGEWKSQYKQIASRAYRKFQEWK